MLQKYFKTLYQRTMRESYALAYKEIIQALESGGNCLDSGAHKGKMYRILHEAIPFQKDNYFGIEWSSEHVQIAQDLDLNVIQGDLNQDLEFPDHKFKCIFGLSVLEHLLNPCRYLRECHRVLEDNGTLVILTPNISTYFTAMLILLGKMPSTGPHPDSDQLLSNEELFKVTQTTMQTDAESDTPVHRHLVVFSYRVLISYLKTIGFRDVKGHGFGLYPFPNFTQPVLEKIDPFHCHQMVIVAKK